MARQPNTNILSSAENQEEKQIEAGEWMKCGKSS